MPINPLKLLKLIQKERSLAEDAFNASRRAVVPAKAAEVVPVAPKPAKAVVVAPLKDASRREFLKRSAVNAAGTAMDLSPLTSLAKMANVEKALTPISASLTPLDTATARGLFWSFNEGLPETLSAAGVKAFYKSLMKDTKPYMDASQMSHARSILKEITDEEYPAADAYSDLAEIFNELPDESIRPERLLELHKQHIDPQAFSHSSPEDLREMLKEISNEYMDRDVTDQEINETLKRVFGVE